MIFSRNLVLICMWISLCAFINIDRCKAQSRRCSAYCLYYSRCFAYNRRCRNLFQRCCRRTPTQVPTHTPTTTTATLPSGPTTAVRECGMSRITGPAYTYLASSRIIGGERSSDCQYPWMATVRTSRGFCGGTIIDSTHILTAAHCVVRRNSVISPRLLRIGVGSFRQSRTRPASATNITVHPRYRSGRYDDDIAVVTLAQQLTWSNCLRPLCLPVAGEEVTPGQVCVTAGWGLTREKARRTEDVLRSVKVPIIDNRVCARVYRRIAVINRNHVCAGSIRTGGRDACSGDSGGPMMCGSGNQWKIMGVVSFGRGCGRRGSPGVYTYVPAYLTWIHGVVG